MAGIIPESKTIRKDVVMNLLVYFSIIIALFLVLTFFLLEILTGNAQAKLSELTQTFEKERTSEEKALEKEVLDYQKKINEFPRLIAGYQKSNNLFEYLEKITHPKVWFSDFSFSAQGLKAILSGETENFQTLGEQLLIFQEDEKIRTLNLSKVSFDEKGKVNFTFELSFDAQVFK